jgi:PST family polysaccharide transporter
MATDSSNISQRIMKAMGLFGGVQAVGVICSIVRTKLVALWMGDVGMGLFGLFNQALEMINTGTNLSIRQSSVRDVSQAVQLNDDKLIARIITVVRRWSLWLGLAGALLTMAFAPLLSEVTFGDSAHIWGFVALSAAVLLMAVTNGEYAVFQGLAKLRRLARVTMFGTLSGLAISIPLFYFFRLDSVVPSIVAYAASAAFFALVLKNKEYPPARISNKETAAVGKDFVKLGVYMTIGNFVTMLAAYVFNAWLNLHAGTGEVGLYQAGYTLVNKYVGLVLAALGMEYYPRLARVAHSKMRLRAFVSQEINISMMVMMPIVAIFILLRTQVVDLLYTEDFRVIVTFISLGMAGTVLRTVSWCIAFVILAKGAGKVYLLTETLSAITGLALNIVCYMQWGLTGLGVSYVLWYGVYTVIVSVVYCKHFGLTLTRGCLLSLVGTLTTSAAMVVLMEQGWWIAAAVLTLVIACVAVLAVRHMWKRR